MLARGLGPDGRGQFAIALAVFSLGSTLGNLGQAERFASDLRDGSSMRVGPRYFIVVVSSLLAAVAAYIAMTATGASAYTSIAVCLAVPVASVGLMWRSVAVARGRVLLLAVQAAAPAILRLALLSIVFFAGILTTFAATALTMLTTALGVLVLYGALKRQETVGESSQKPKLFDQFLLHDIRIGVMQGMPVVDSRCAHL